MHLPAFKNSLSIDVMTSIAKSLRLMMALSFCSTALFAAPSNSFSHKDWEVVCDNLLTCRAAGYQSDNSEQLVSVLLTRKAGAMSAVTAQVQLGGWLDDAAAEGKTKLPNPLPISLWLDQKNYGSIKLALDSRTGDLTAAQTQALLSALKQAQPIEFRYQNIKWPMSGEGSSAVLLKMDDLQGCVGTATALIRKGNASLKQIKVAAMLPVIQALPVNDTQAQDLDLNSTAAQNLLSTLHEVTGRAGEDCETLTDSSQFEGQALKLYPLNAKTTLVEVPCWRGAYNEGYGYWVMDANLKQMQQLVTLSGSSYAQGSIEMAQKGRGIGDCWSTATWLWTKQGFVLSAEETDSMCRGFAGGAWDMPSFVSKVDKTIKP